MPLLDATYVQRYRGYLGWEGFTDGQSVVVPPMEVELYIQNYQVPIRKPKITEHVTISQIDPVSGHEAGSAGIFYGAPSLLQMELTGWTVTLQDSNKQWILKDRNGTTVSPISGSPSTFWGNIPYSEVVNVYLSGRINLTANGAYQRRDPDYYISPGGLRYSNPIISAYTSNFQPGVKKQLFTMTLLLET